MEEIYNLINYHRPFQSLSLYIHVPFCAQKCNYCDFYSIPFNESLIDSYVSALLVEWKLMKNTYSLHDIPVQTLYFGGGTPSILPLRQWKRIIEHLIWTLPFAPDYEWSVECNPESFTSEIASLWLDSGVSRLSIGVQSLRDDELRSLGRVHNARQALACLENPLLFKFKSTGVDLMYGIPRQTLDSLGASLMTILALPATRHLSAYELTISSSTDFGRRRGILPLPPEDAIVAMTEMISRKTFERDFEQYEISNFSLPDHHCRHNEAYWQHAPYIGLGPAAHSYLPPRRFSNVSSLDAYTKKLREQELPTGFSETLDSAALSRELVFLGLRTKQGVNETRFRVLTGTDFASSMRLPMLEAFVQRGLMEHTLPHWRLTSKGMLFADALARDLL